MLKFCTGFGIVPPHGIGLSGKIAIKFLADDDELPYPKALSRLHLLSIPTVHTTYGIFREYFLKALEYESEVYAGECYIVRTRLESL